MTEYKYVDWPGLQYYHGKVTDLIDSRLRNCIKFGGEVLFEDLEAPDAPELNTVYKVLNSFTVSSNNGWFSDKLSNKTFVAGTILQVVQNTEGIVYNLFLQPTTNSGSGVDLDNYYTIDEVNDRIVEALKPYATVDFVLSKLAAIQSLLDTTIDDVGKLVTRVTKIEQTITDTIAPSIENIGATIVDIETRKADKQELEGLAKETYVEDLINNIKVPTKVSELENDAGYLTTHQDLSDYAKLEDIPDLEGYASEDFVKQKILEAQLAEGEIDVSSFYTKNEIDAKKFATENYVQQMFDDVDSVNIDSRLTALENQTTTDTTRLTSVEDIAESNSAAIEALDGEIDRVDSSLVSLDAELSNVAKQLDDVRTYGTF